MTTKWRVEFLEEALEDFRQLDHSIRLRLKSALRKLESDPIAYGDPLGKRQGRNLEGLYSLRGLDRKIRVIYAVFDGLIQVVLVIAVGARERMQVHQLAYERLLDIEDILRQLTELAADDKDTFDEVLQLLLRQDAN